MYFQIVMKEIILGNQLNKQKKERDLEPLFFLFI